MTYHIRLLGVPMDLGQGRRGVDMGVSAIRYAQVLQRLVQLGHDVLDLGDIDVPYLEERVTNDENLKCLKEVVLVNQLLADQVSQIVSAGHFPLVLGGDHSIAIGTIAGLASHHTRLGVIWCDAHGDLNTGETSPSGNIHGMSLAVSLGRGHEQLTQLGGAVPKIKPEDVVIIGARSLDEGEKRLIRDLGLKVYTMHEVDRMGMTKVMEEAIAQVSREADRIHLSFDLDVLDPQDAPGVGTPVAGGLSYRESHLAMEMLAETGLITSAEFVEVNPILDQGNKTAEVAVSLIGSLLGEKLL